MRVGAGELKVWHWVHNCIAPGSFAAVVKLDQYSSPPFWTIAQGLQFPRAPGFRPRKFSRQPSTQVFLYQLSLRYQSFIYLFTRQETLTIGVTTPHRKPSAIRNDVLPFQPHSSHHVGPRTSICEGSERWRSKIGSRVLELARVVLM